MGGHGHHHLTLEQYFDIEVHSETRFEYCDGLVIAVARGGSLRHNVLVADITATLDKRFKRTHQTFPSGQRIATGDGLHTYADASVIALPCAVTSCQGTGTLHNPVLVVEVLSDATRDYDVSEKLEHYQTTPVGSSRVDLQACKLEYSIVSPK